MTSLLQVRWNTLKEEIEGLKPFGGNDIIRKRIRILKNEASVLKFAMERVEQGYSSGHILSMMKEDRAAYKKMWGNYAEG